MPNIPIQVEDQNMDERAFSEDQVESLPQHIVDSTVKQFDQMPPLSQASSRPISNPMDVQLTGV